ncbi:MAG: nicotinamide riboside transporter PnuC [Pseudomonadales bacterium]|nr:nicotinamide riboside transporter PnuC [Pseudomonadales bacterium]
MIELIPVLGAVEIFGLLSGLLCVWLLVKQNIWTWAAATAYVLASLYVFYNARLYANFGLHIVYLLMNFYGWYYWFKGGKRGESGLGVSRESGKLMLFLSALALILMFISGSLFAHYSDARLPYLDNTVSMFSLLALWLQSRKKLESWILWLAIDALSIVIYYSQALYFYSLLYLVYVGLAIMGYRAWRKSMIHENPH